jgi:hypothetical protein
VPSGMVAVTVQVGDPAQQLCLGGAHRRPQLAHLGQPAGEGSARVIGCGQHRDRVQQRPYAGRPVGRRLPRTRTHVVMLSSILPGGKHLRFNPQWTDAKALVGRVGGSGPR